MPLYYGLLNEDFIQSIRNSNTYEESAFAREYMSKWTSASEGSLFNYDKLESLRKLKRAEWKATNITEDVYYVLSVDVARLAARTVASVLKVRRGNDRFSVNVVNIYLMEGRNFLFQAAKLKELHGAYGFNNVIIDGLGLGVGLIDFLMIETVHPETGHVYPPWNVQNVQKYKEYLPEQKIGAEALLHIIKALILEISFFNVWTIAASETFLLLNRRHSISSKSTRKPLCFIILSFLCKK